MSKRTEYNLLNIANIIMAFAFLLVGFSPDDGGGLLHKLALVTGGLLIGHVLTEVLNAGDDE